MSSIKRKSVTGVLLALAMMSGPSLAKDKYKMTPEERQLYNLQLQKYQADVAKWDAEHPAEARAQWEQTQRSMAANQCRDAAGRNTCAPPPPAPDKGMCLIGGNWFPCPE